MRQPLQLRRLFGLVLVGALATSASAACSSSDSGSGGGGSAPGNGATALPPCPVDALDTATEPVEIVVWHTLAAKNLETTEAVVQTYNASQSKVKVRLESQGTGIPEIQAKFNAAVSSQGLPAALIVDDTLTQSMADSGVVLPAQSCIDADNYDMSVLRKVAVDYYTIDGALWPASANIYNALLYYNKITSGPQDSTREKPPTTLAEVREYAEKIKAAGLKATDGSDIEKPLIHELSSFKTEFLLTGAHSPMVDNDNGRGPGTTSKAMLADNEEALELFRWYRSMADDGLMDAIPFAPGQVNHFYAMAGRKGSMMIESSAAATSIEAFLGGNLNTTALPGEAPVNPEDVSGLSVGAAAMPGLSPGGRTQMGGNAWYMTSTGSPEVQAATWDFMKYLNEPEAQSTLLIGGSAHPFRNGVSERPEVQEFYASSLSGGWLKLSDQQVDQIDPAFPGPLIGPYDQFRVAIQKSGENLLLGGASPEEALATAQADVDAALERYNREFGG